MGRLAVACALALALVACGQPASQPEETANGTTRSATTEETSERAITHPPDAPMGENAAPEMRAPQYSTPPAAAETDCQLRKATAGMSPEEAQAYVEEVTTEMIESGKTLSEILAERGFEC